MLDVRHHRCPAPRVGRAALVLLLVCASLVLSACRGPEAPEETESSEIGSGWAGNSINAVVFRRNSLTTHEGVQYAAYYDASGHAVLAKRDVGTDEWEVERTRYRGDLSDAHNSISIAVDGNGYVHVAWDNHDSPLRYARGVEAGSLELGEEQPMTGLDEGSVTYPEFYRLPEGDLIALYRDGASGDGSLVVNSYDATDARWSQSHSELIAGEGDRNAYWQAAVDRRGDFHLSWVWRETSDVTSNHDICYALSGDGGKTWTDSEGIPYALPITAETAEYVRRIPEGSTLINQTSMCADSDGRPYIATYWEPEGSGAPQYQLLYRDEETWRVQQITRRETDFSLEGEGTKRIPMSRPQVVVEDSEGAQRVFVVFRDAERGNRVSVARSDDLEAGGWSISDLTARSVGQWEPTYDTERWHEAGELDLLVQDVAQRDAETSEDVPPSQVSVLTWVP